MTLRRCYLALAGAVMVASGCSAGALSPALTGGPPKGLAEGAPAETPQTPAIAPPESPPQLAQAAPPAPGQPTFVGQRVAQLRAELQRLQGTIGGHNGELQQNRTDTATAARQYHAHVAAINSRLQVGTTPGNPELVAQWTLASAELDKLSANVGRLTRLSTAAAGNSAMAAYLLDSTRAAYALSGAVEDDHKQLAVMEDEIGRTGVMIDRLLTQLNEDVLRQTNYVNGERRNLTLLSLAIKNGELYGPSLGNRGFAPAPPQLTPPGSPAATPPEGAPKPGGAATPGLDPRRPLVVIKFDRANVEYEQALYAAVSQALDRRPDAVFELVAVSPGKGEQPTGSATAARRHAEQVMRSLTGMGLPANRVSLSATSSPLAKSNEVHLYVR